MLWTKSRIVAVLLVQNSSLLNRIAGRGLASKIIYLMFCRTDKDKAADYSGLVLLCWPVIALSSVMVISMGEMVY